MEKKKSTKFKNVIMKFFPNIDELELIKIIGEESNEYNSKYKNYNSSLNSDENIIDFVNQNNKDYININRNRDDIFELQDRAKRIKKAETTMNIPVISNNFQMPDFLLKNVKTYSKTNLSSTSVTFNKIKNSNFAKTDVVFCHTVDGSFHSDLGFEILVKKFGNLSKDIKALLVYVTPNVAEDKTNNYRNKKEIILHNYTVNMRNLDSEKYYFLHEEKNPKYKHSIEQVDKIAEKYTASFLLTGFAGLKGPKGDNKELNKGLEYLLRNCKMPMIILKESIINKPENSNMTGNNWLFVFDKINGKCYNIVNKFFGLIDPEKDTVYGLSLIHHKDSLDDLEHIFINDMKQKKVKSFFYENQKYESDSYVIVTSKVNFGIIHYDFVVIYNNYGNRDFSVSPNEKQILSNISVISGCSSNICILNGN